MSDLLNIGASGIYAYQSALAAIGNNVSNANTPGYTRRTVNLEENVSADGGMFGYNASASFNGVVTADVGRAWNDYQAVASRTTASDAGSASARSTWLSNVESALNDGATGVGESATAVFNAGDTLASNPGDTTNRKLFLYSLDQTASAFHTTASALADVSDGIATQAQTVVQTVNADLDALDKVNAGLARQTPGSSAQADLEDQRDRLIDDLSGQISVDVKIADNGSATVTLPNSGAKLTSDAGSIGSGTRLAMAVGSNGTLAIQAVKLGKSQAVNGLGGQLGGLVDSAATTADRRNSLDTMANNFATAVNAWQAQGNTSAGTAGAALFTGTTASTITLATSDPAAIAAASTGASGTANGNLLTLSSLRGSTGLEQSWSTMVTDQGQIVANAKSEATATASAADAAMSARDNSTGVDLDTEAAELIRYQQAYSGAAKVIQVAKDTMQSILDLF